MSGFVDAPYATVNETLGIASVRDRLYRGFCRGPEITQAIRAEYVSKEQAIMGAVKRYEKDFDAKTYGGIVKYMQDFFETMKNDSKFKASILDKCRTQ
jgi:hypothetical protein